MDYTDSARPSTDAMAALPPVRRGTIEVMSAACGVMVANIYLCQPLLDEIARNLAVPKHVAGLVAVAAQLGYALGILLVLPLADVAAPRRLVRVLTAVTALGLLAEAAAPGIAPLVVASLIVAGATVVPQMLIPLATALVAPDRRGRVIGSLQTGLILGILLSRTVSGAVAAWTGSWRAPFVLAALITAAVCLILPSFMPLGKSGKTGGSYLSLLRSLPYLLEHRALRVSAALGFCVFGAFSVFWATLAFHLAGAPFGLGTAATGLFGLWGAPGAIMAPMGGRLADRVGANWVNAGSIVFAGLAFAVAGLLGGFSLLALVLAVNLLDFGMQSGQIANQARIFALRGDIRARLNTVYMVATFSGGALGSLVATIVWSAAGWTGVCSLAAGLIATAALVLSLAARRER